MSAPESRRTESIRLLANSLERAVTNRAFDIECANPGVKVVAPPRDFMAEAERLYDAELDRLVMEQCNAVVDRLWKKPDNGLWACWFCRGTYTTDKLCCERQREFRAEQQPAEARVIDLAGEAPAILKAAEEIADYMEKNHGTQWKLGKIQSRDGES